MVGGVGVSNQEKYSDFWSEINKRQISNTESLDKALLSLSTAGLGFSLSIAKFISLKDTADYLLLFIVWSLFGLTIISTVISFIISQKALDNVLEYAEKYYLNNDESYLNKEDIWIKSVRWISLFSITTFLLAIIFAIIFSIQNFQIKKDNHMSKDNKEINIKNMTSKNEATNIPTMLKVPKEDTVTNGAEIPKMQPKQPAEKSTTDNKEK
ncbi:MAG: hypothetical protein KAH72_08175 [Flavobacteriaceae bacterium]|nr:hypothetical protein [Flavobacteriaceae bacterium]